MSAASTLPPTAFIDHWSKGPGGALRALLAWRGAESALHPRSRRGPKLKEVENKEQLSLPHIFL